MMINSSCGACTPCVGTCVQGYLTCPKRTPPGPYHRRMPRILEGSYM